jgi:hypothetical protein
VVSFAFSFSHSHRGFSPMRKTLVDFPNRFNGNNILDAPVLAPEEQDVYSLQSDTARALQRSAMDANNREHFAPNGAMVVECFRAINLSLLRSKEQVRQLHYDRFNGLGLEVKRLKETVKTVPDVESALETAAKTIS